CLFELAQEIVKEFQTTCPSRQFLFEREGVTQCLLDRDRLAQVITNLVSNASTYGNAAPIVVRVVGNDTEIGLDVHNWGEPIAPELISELFQPLKRGNTSASRGSIGLGLFIASEVVRAHAGSIAVRSSADHGTTFTVRMPRMAAATVGPAAALERASAHD
ncbi:MAG TPA: HAMP domain-containing sensor histidine kinase, partial [Polyangiaceae bacterium]|nr:HAMP domain-containing sensor histidine kinase [Polyangiaceae bacterium]